ncbi:MAG: AraC family transcriptional regulator, partial [Spirochaetaceae bacterium]
YPAPAKHLQAVPRFLALQGDNQTPPRGGAAALLTTSMAAKEVAESVGLGSANYFLTLFKKEFGMSPTSYRRRYTGARNGRNGGEE